jgi:hypothetical protein
MANKETRREILKKALHVAPVILTLTASPASAKRGSGVPDKHVKHDKHDD